MHSVTVQRRHGTLRQVVEREMHVELHPHSLELTHLTPRTQKEVPQSHGEQGFRLEQLQARCPAHLSRTSRPRFAGPDLPWQPSHCLICHLDNIHMTNGKTEAQRGQGFAEGQAMRPAEHLSGARLPAPNRAHVLMLSNLRSRAEQQFLTPHFWPLRPHISTGWVSPERTWMWCKHGEVRTCWDSVGARAAVSQFLLLCFSFFLLFFLITFPWSHNWLVHKHFQYFCPLFWKTCIGFFIHLSLQ